MKRERDTHHRPRGSRGGRLERADLVRQELGLANDELDKALEAPDARTMREHVALARRFVLEASKKLRGSE